MNPHADSVQQPSDASLTLAELADKCGATNAYTNSPKIGFSPEAWMRFDNALRAIRFGTRPAAEPSQSGSAGEAEFTPPAVTDKEMGVGAFTEREAQIIFFCMDQMQDLSDRDWRDHGFRQSTFFNANRKLYALLTQEPKRGHHD